METFIIVFIIASAIYVFLFIRTQKKRHKINKKDKKFILQKWEEIKQMPGNHAVIEADKLLDYALKLKGAQGSMADKLKSSENLFSDVNAIWQAHKLRNSIAHEINFKINEKEKENALKKFKKGLKDLGI